MANEERHHPHGNLAKTRLCEKTTPLPSAGARQIFVLGIFASAAAAGDAVRILAARPTGARGTMLVSDTDLFGAIGSQHTFQALWESLRAQEGLDGRPYIRGANRLLDHLARRIAGGAAVVITRTESPEEQRSISRALLEADCEILLTHEVTPPLAGPSTEMPSSGVRST